MSFLKFLTQDQSANKGNTKGKILTFLFRIANYAGMHPRYKWVFIPYIILYKFFFEWILGMEIPYKLKVGPGFKIFHLHAVVINERTVIGKNFTLRQSTTIGNKGQGGQSPVIGNNVELGAQVCIIGGIHIGDDVVIGAGSVVVKGLPDHCVAAGNPARIIKQF
jgi:putative colanic acid biosynthesis acetyltransferase WcaB